jgi:hypothetical protein
MFSSLVFFRIMDDGQSANIQYPICHRESSEPFSICLFICSIVNVQHSDQFKTIGLAIILYNPSSVFCFRYFPSKAHFILPQNYCPL